MDNIFGTIYDLITNYDSVKFEESIKLIKSNIDNCFYVYFNQGVDNRELFYKLCCIINKVYVFIDPKILFNIWNKSIVNNKYDTINYIYTLLQNSRVFVDIDNCRTRCRNALNYCYENNEIKSDFVEIMMTTKLVHKKMFNDDFFKILCSKNDQHLMHLMIKNGYKFDKNDIDHIIGNNLSDFFDYIIENSNGIVNDAESPIYYAYKHKNMKLLVKLYKHQHMFYHNQNVLDICNDKNLSVINLLYNNDIYINVKSYVMAIMFRNINKNQFYHVLKIIDPTLLNQYFFGNNGIIYDRLVPLFEFEPSDDLFDNYFDPVKFFHHIVEKNNVSSINWDFLYKSNKKLQYVALVSNIKYVSLHDFPTDDPNIMEWIYSTSNKYEFMALFNDNKQHPFLTKFGEKHHMDLITKFNGYCLWNPSNHYMVPINKQKIVFLVMAIFKSISRGLTHILPKPIMHNIINRFVFI